MENVELTFKYTEDEYVKAERRYLFASKTLTKSNVVIITLFLVFTIANLIISPFSILGAVALGISLFSLGITCLIYFYSPYLKFRKTAKYHEQYNLIFSKDLITFKTPTINSKLNWNVYSEILEDDEFYFMVQRKGIYALIPKRAFNGSEMQQAFEHMATENEKPIKRI